MIIMSPRAAVVWLPYWHRKPRQRCMTVVHAAGYMMNISTAKTKNLIGIYLMIAAITQIHVCEMRTKATNEKWYLCAIGPPQSIYIDWFFRPHNVHSICTQTKCYTPRCYLTHNSQCFAFSSHRVHAAHGDHSPSACESASAYDCIFIENCVSCTFFYFSLTLYCNCIAVLWRSPAR